MTKPEQPPPYSAQQPPYPTVNQPPPAGFQVPPPASNVPYPTQQPNVVIMQQPTTTHRVIVHEILPPVSTLLQCSSCRQNITTRVDYKPGTRTHMWALCMCVFLLWPYCLLPYCMKSCQNANHYCPACGAYIGTAI